MKQPSKPTRRQKEIIRSQGFNEEEWMVGGETDGHLELYKKGTMKKLKLAKKGVGK